jgi:NAD(P)-dependent dehydrogenase (short-subunit alcohol dehydrogenase family)
MLYGGSEQAKAGLLASVPARRASTPEEIADTIVFLASESALYLTGQRVAVGGA